MKPQIIKRTNKYSYSVVIQQLYAANHGYEDVGEYESNSQGAVTDAAGFRHDLNEYRLLGYPTRTIIRKTLN